MNTVPRDRFGRPYIVTSYLDGEIAISPYTRISKYAESLSDSYALGEWQQRMVAKGLAENRFLLPQVEKAIAEDDSKALSAICHVAKEKAGAHDKAAYGTRLHEYTDLWDRGLLTEDGLWPIEGSLEEADLMAYIHVMEATGIKIVASERFVVNDTFRAAGTFDRIIELHGTKYIADLKTGRIDIDPLKFAMQFALYANATYYECTHEIEEPTREACQLNPLLHKTELHGADERRAVLIHLPAEQGRCDWYWVDIEAGLEACELAEEVKTARKRKGILTPFNPDDPPF